MKIDLSFSGKAGSVQLTLDKEFVYGELASLTSVLSDIVEGKSILDDFEMVIPEDHEEAPSVSSKDYAKRYSIKFSVNSSVDSAIYVIKIVREHLGLTLKDAKDVVENKKPCPPMDLVTLRKIQLDFDLMGESGFKNYSVVTLF